MQTLRGLVLSCERMGQRLKPIADQLANYLNPQVKGTLFEDLASTNTRHESIQGTECWLEGVVLEYLRNLLVRMGKTLPVAGATMPAKAREYDKLKHRGVIFSPASFSNRDSHVVIGKAFPGDWYAGKIKQIFTYPFGLPGSQDGEAYIVVQKFKELSVQEAVQDPYRRYPMVGGRLYHSELEEQFEVVTVQDVIAHFAYIPHDGLEFGFPCFHALPLNKVSFSQHQWSNANFSISNVCSAATNRGLCAEARRNDLRRRICRDESEGAFVVKLWHASVEGENQSHSELG